MNNTAPPNGADDLPNMWTWGLKVAASAGLTGMLCCVAPMLLFMMGIMGGTYAISFADFFYEEDGTVGMGAWLLRLVAVAVGMYGFFRYRNQQRFCSLDPMQQKKNLALLGMVIVVLGVALFLSLEALSSWYFDAYIVPAQQDELGLG